MTLIDKTVLIKLFSRIALGNKMENELVFHTSSMLDYITTAQLIAEREITNYLCYLPGQVLDAAGNWTPEIGQRERQFWQQIQRISNLKQMSQENQNQIVIAFAYNNGYKKDFLKWMAEDQLDFDERIMPRVKELLVHITLLHRGWIALDILAKNPQIIQRGRYAG
jgi:hypothetical protein